MLCHVVSCRVASGRVVAWRGVAWCGMSCCVVLRQTMPCDVMACHVIPYQSISRHAKPCLASPCHAMQRVVATHVVWVVSCIVNFTLCHARSNSTLCDSFWSLLSAVSCVGVPHMFSHDASWPVVAACTQRGWTHVSYPEHGLRPVVR